MKHTINSEHTLSEMIGLLRATFKEKHFLQVTLNTGKKRTISQNAIGHAWYRQVSLEENEYTPGEIKNMCKYRYGLPILRGDDEKYNEACRVAIDPLSYANRIKAMEYWPVTSLMNTNQETEYLESVQRHYAGRCDLKFGEE